MYQCLGVGGKGKVEGGLYTAAMYNVRILFWSIICCLPCVHVDTEILYIILTITNHMLN